MPISPEQVADGIMSMTGTAISGILTLLIAAFAAMIAYFQWRTAHQRIVLDLFDRRVEVFEDLESIARRLVQTSDVSNDDLRLFWKARGKARFLYGPEVNDYLMDELLDDLAWRNTFTDDVIQGSQPNERQGLIQKKYDILKRASKFNQDKMPLFEPYMKLDQKMPSQWLPM